MGSCKRHVSSRPVCQDPDAPKIACCSQLKAHAACVRCEWAGRGGRYSWQSQTRRDRSWWSGDDGIFPVCVGGKHTVSICAVIALLLLSVAVCFCCHRRRVLLSSLLLSSLLTFVLLLSSLLLFALLSSSSSVAVVIVVVRIVVIVVVCCRPTRYPTSKLEEIRLYLAGSVVYFDWYLCGVQWLP